MAKKLTSAKAREILHDKEVHGHPLTDKQRRFFGAIAGGAPLKAYNGAQENYNNPSVSYPPGFVGMNNNTKGFDYNSAWGGRWENGGQMNFLQPTSGKLPKGYQVPYNIPSTERAMSIGGEEGEPAYLIPSFKYGEPLRDPVGEFRRTREHLGGPFKTWQEADQWEQQVRHPYVEKGQDIPTPLRRWGKDFEDGGIMPGATGNIYARHGAPSEGKFAKKTLPSAAFGEKMTYYQNGLDFQPKTISEDGSVLGKAGEMAGEVGEKMLTAADDIMFAPQRGLVKLFTGKYQLPSEAMGISEEHPWLSLAADTILDPMNLVGAGLVTKVGKLGKIGKAIRATGRGIREGVGGAERLERLGKGIDMTSKTLIAEGMAKNTEKEFEPIAQNVSPIMAQNMKRMQGTNYMQNLTGPQYFKEGGKLQKTKLDQLTNFTNYNKPTRGGWLDKYQ